MSNDVVLKESIKLKVESYNMGRRAAALDKLLNNPREPHPETSESYKLGYKSKLSDAKALFLLG